MPVIKKLPPHEAQKIAAGEVVERPANVVKELLENAIDAGATQISLYIEDGGKQLIRIVDNGCGMSEEDAHLCFEHHATSKIKSVEDLETISTFGFRGEALSSIASVSKVTLITKAHDAEQGIKLELAGNEITNKEAVSANTGTDLSVRDIFYNVPARQKFLKKKETEWRHILQLFTAFCFGYKEIHFKLISEGKTVLNCPPVEELPARHTQLKHHQIAQHMIPLQTNGSINGITVTGIISNHQFFRYDRNNIFFFVNNRWIKNYSLTNALLKGYLRVAPPGKYPAACIFITVNPDEVDINIHPRKEEVQFLHPRRIGQLLKDNVKHTLEEHLSSQIKKEVHFAPIASAYMPNKSHDWQNNVTPVFIPNKNSNRSAFAPAFNNEQLPSGTPFSTINTTTQNGTQSNSAELMPTEPIANLNLEQQTVSSFAATTTERNYTLIGQFRKTYLLLEKEEGLFVVDQHAAHERILYELFSKRFEDVATIQLLFPHMITFTMEDITTIKPHLALFKQNGIEVEQFSDTQLVIKATPVHLKNVSMNNLIRSSIGWINEYQHLDLDQFSKAMHEKMHAQMACKAAVKAGDILTHEKMHQLLEDLYKTNNRFTCPHGRPTGWLLSTHDIEKKFKRKL